jgi:hypothetical protein
MRSSRRSALNHLEHAAKALACAARLKQ